MKRSRILQVLNAGMLIGSRMEKMRRRITAQQSQWPWLRAYTWREKLRRKRCDLFGHNAEAIGSWIEARRFGADPQRPWIRVVEAEPARWDSAYCARCNCYIDRRVGTKKWIRSGE